VATDNDTVYAFNADGCGSAIWSQHLDTPKTTTDTNFSAAKVGCTSTPVIDSSAGVIYLVCVNSTDVWKLFALNISDGSTFHAAVTISGTAQGLTFDSTSHQARTALLLSGGKVDFGFASYNDGGTWQGWAFAYNSTTLAQTAVFVTVNTSGGRGGIWQAGGGMAADGSGNVYCTVGNGSFDGTNNFGECILKLNSSLVVQDYLVNSGWATLNTNDTDQGSGRPILVGTRVMSGGKNGVWWITDQSNMGHTQVAASPSSQVQDWAGQIELFDASAFANNGLYTIDNSHVNPALPAGIQRNTYNGTTFTTTPSATSYVYPTYMSGVAYSSNGASNGILWVNSCQVYNLDVTQVGALRAFDGTTLSLLYDSTAKAGDAVGNCAKYVSPTVANGKVYLSTFSNTVVVFGPMGGGQLSSKSVLAGGAIH